MTERTIYELTDRLIRRVMDLNEIPGAVRDSMLGDIMAIEGRYKKDIEDLQKKSYVQVCIDPESIEECARQLSSMEIGIRIIGSEEGDG